MSLKDKAIIVDSWDMAELTEKVYSTKDVKEAVLEYINYKKSLLFTEKEIDNSFDKMDKNDKLRHNDNLISDLNKFNEIFGDFEND